MAEQRIYQPEWRDEQGDSRYPFADGAALLAQSGLVLGNDVFLDAVFYPPGAGARLYLTSVEAEGSRTVTLYVGDPASPRLASATLDPLDPPSSLVFADRYGRPAGLVVSDPTRLASFQTWPLGSHQFGTSAEIATACVIPTPAAGVRGFVLEDGKLFTGDVWLVGEDGVVVRQDGDRTIRFDLVGDPLFRRRLCQPTDLFNTPRFIKTINGHAPDERGNFTITVNDEMAGDVILRIYPDPDADVVRVEVVGQKTEGVV